MYKNCRISEEMMKKEKTERLSSVFSPFVSFYIRIKHAISEMNEPNCNVQHMTTHTTKT